MSRSRYSKREVAQRGEELYTRAIRPNVETEANIGKVIAIDILSGDYQVGDDLISTGDALRLRHPDAEIWFERIGYNAVFAVGGVLTRTKL